MKWSHLSGKLQSLLCALVLVPVIEAGVWALLIEFGGERNITVLAGVAAGPLAGVGALSLRPDGGRASLRAVLAAGIAKPAPIAPGRGVHDDRPPK